MNEYRVKRTGDSDLVFRGEVVASAHNDRDDVLRWNHVTIYRTEGGRYVVSIAYRSDWATKNNGKEPDDDFADVCGTAREVRNALAVYDPAARLVGYPHGEQFAARQERLRNDLRANWRAVVSRALSADEFAERVE